MRKQQRKSCVMILTLFIGLTLLSVPAWAGNATIVATGSTTCPGYCVTITVSGLGSNYNGPITGSVNYTITLTPTTGGAPITISGDMRFQTDNIIQNCLPWGQSISGSFNVTGTAVLTTSDNQVVTVPIDFGSNATLSCPACTGVIGDFVWNDVNHNGIQDSGEAGIPGMTVQLWNSSQTTLVQSTTTNGSGIYLFTGLCADTYTVVIPTPPPGSTPTISHAGQNPAVDSNGSPAPVTLPTGNSTDLTIDFGYIQNACIPSPLFTLGPAGSYTVLGLDNGSVTISEAGTIVTGNVGLGPNDVGSLLKATIKGALKLDSTAKPDIHPDLTVTGGTTIVSLGSTTAAAIAASNNLASMPPGQSFGDITASATFTSTGAVNVIALKSVNLVKGTITIKGGPADVFIFQVAGQFNFSSSQMVLSGGVTPNNIIWNFSGAGGDVDIFKDVTNAYGFFLAPQRNIIQDHANVTGGYIGLNVTVHSAAIVTYPCP